MGKIAHINRSSIKRSFKLSGALVLLCTAPAAQQTKRRMKGVFTLRLGLDSVTIKILRGGGT